MIPTNITNMIYRLSKQGEKVIESEQFRGLNYVIKNGHIVLMAEDHGIFSFKFDAFDFLVDEIKEIIDEWKDIKTKNCIVTGVIIDD